ncbi:MAG: PilZ domain-containing protein [Cognaticolwellia sp.]
MNKDFSKYQKIIDDFSGQVLQNDFEAKFNAVAKNIVKTERFLLKMELKRLASPCTRLIDLRGHVNGECKAFEHGEKKHYLDSIAARVFTQALARYGSYTLGVYEAATSTENNFRVMYQKERSTLGSRQQVDTSKAVEKSQYPAKHYRFGGYHNRCEERMNFSVAIQVTLDDGSTFDCVSSDLSVNGCKIKINGIKPLSVDQQITLRFTGWEAEFQFGDEHEFSYQIKNLTKIDHMLLVGVKRANQDKRSRDGFSQFLSDFIRGNKRRYKINLDNTINALQARSLEQYVLPKSNELPIFIAQNDGVLTPKYALTCHNNQSTYQYWQDEKHHSTLYCLMTPERIERLKQLREQGKNLLVFSFIHKNQNKRYFYTADAQQLSEDPKFMAQFLAFAASKGNFAITQLALLDVSPSYAESPLTLSNTLTAKNAYLNAPISDDVKQLLENIPYIVVATDVSQNESIKAYQALASSSEQIDMEKLKKFGHKRQSQPFIVDEVAINYRNQRQELRFSYKTPAKVEIESVKWQGFSRDFSTSGLMIELDKATVLNKGDIVDIGFPALQKITSSFDLTALRYEVMHINSAKTIVNLRAFVEKHQHVGRKFFKALIDKNRDKLSSDEYAMASPSLVKALRNIYSASALVPSIVVQSSGSRYKAQVIAGGNAHSELMLAMKKLSDGDSAYNLYPIFGHAQMMTNLSARLKKMQQSDIASTELVYLSITDNSKAADSADLEKSAAVDETVSIKLASELSDEASRQAFIEQALQQGTFFCLMLKLSRSDEPDMDHLNPELSYISSYALHRGKQLEQDIWSVAGIAQILDVTDEVLFRMQLTHNPKLSNANITV